MIRSTVIVADDDRAIRTVLNQVLSRMGHEVLLCENISTLWARLAQGEGDLVISDLMMPDGNAFDIMPRLQKTRPDLPVIIMSARNTFMTAIKASEAGAYDYIPKPFDLAELTTIINRALAEIETPSGEHSIKAIEEHDEIPIVGRSPAMQEIYRVLARLMQSEISVLIKGESGTGKELAAKSLHDFGKRKTGPFVAVNMAAIPKDLIEAELFGHERGAFTGAVSRSAGRFEQASGGTLFLDEIGDMPLEAQTRLLRVLQEGEFTTVGGIKTIKTDVRIISATHQDMDQLIRQGRFREDLYYRLNVVPIRIPSLRERKEDIPDLINFFIARDPAYDQLDRSFDAEAISILKGLSWPGNVRELENFVQRILTLYPDEVISKEIVEQELTLTEVPVLANVANAEIDNLELYAEKYLSNYFLSFGNKLPPHGLHSAILNQVERPLITATLYATRGNQIRAADLLGINRNTLRKKIKEFDIQVLRTPKAN